MSNRFFKDPDAVKDFHVAWSAWLDGDTIQSSQWIVPEGITKDSDSNTDTTATIWLSGGTAGVAYEVTNRITTVGGRTEDRTLLIKVEEQ